MAVIVWDQIGDRVYETGLDRGVLYFPDGGGVAWNGLTSVSAGTSTAIESIYYDGVKFNDIITVGDFTASLKAFTYPDEFMEYEGIIEDQSGVFVTSQQQKMFHLSYRTRIGDDINGIDQGYKLHLLWNLIAVPSKKVYETLSLDANPHEFEWSLTSVPEDIERYSPTSHVIIDSRRIDRKLLDDIETILYGGDDREPFLPSLKGLTSYIRKWERLIIVDNGDGTWTATSPLPDAIEMLNFYTFEIDDANATYLDANTYEVESTEKNEEDIY